MTLSLSQRAARIVKSEIRTMTIECEKVGGINLAQGVCDTEVPLPVQEAARLGVKKGFNSYTRYDGLDILRQGIARKLKTFNGLEADPETEITVSSGSTGAMYTACLALLDPGDEVILFEPYYGYHVNTLLAAEAVPRYVTLSPPDWTFRLEDMERVASSRTRAIIVNTPSNPTGKVFSREELEVIASFVVSHDLFVLTDEIYEYFVFDDRQHISPAVIPGLEDRTITISGFSKTFSITGWRVGYSVAPAKMAQVIGHINDLVYICAPAPLQYGVAVGMTELSEEFYKGLSIEYTDKRNVICGALEASGLLPYVPQGAYYVLADVSCLPGATSKDKAMHLLTTIGVASVPGEAFLHGDGGKNLVRFCFAKTDEELEAACDRIRKLK